MLFRLPRKPSPRRRRHFQPLLEILDERSLPSVTWINPNGGDWNTATNWLDTVTGTNHVPGSVDDVIIDMGDITVTDALSSAVNNFSLSSATLTGGGSVSAQGGMTITGGTLDDFTLTNPAGQTATLPGTLNLQNNALFDNEGTLSVGNTGLMTRGSGDTSAVLLRNNGSITKPAGSGNAGLHVPIDSNGPILLNAGDLDLGDDLGSMPSAFAGPITAATGTILYLTGGSSVSTFTGDVSADRVDFLDAATYQFDGAYASTSTTTEGAVTFAGSVSQFGSLTVNNGTTDLSQANLSAAAASLTNLTVSGTLVVPQTLTVQDNVLLGGGMLTDGGSVMAQGGMTITGGTLDDFTLTNAAGQTATLSGTLNLQHNALFDNDGVLSVGNTGLMTRGSGDTSAVLLRNNGSITKPAGSGNAGLHVPIDSNGPITLDAGALDLGDDLGSMPSTFAGPITAATGTILYLTGGSSVSTFTGGVSADRVDFFDAATYQFDGAYASTSTTTEGAVTFAGSVSQFGSLTVNNGTTDLSQANLSAAAANLASVTVSGTLVAPQTLTVQDLNLSGTLQAGSVTVSQAFNWFGGTLSSSGTITISSTATLTLDGSENFAMQGGVLSNDGTMVLEQVLNGGTLQMSGGAIIDNYGAFLGDTGANRAFTLAGAGTGEAFYNLGAGTVTQTGLGATRVDVSFFNNSTSSMAVQVRNGALDLDGGGTSTGSFTGQTGSALYFGDSYTLAPTVSIQADFLGLSDANSALSLPFVNRATGVQFASISANAITLNSTLTISDSAPLHAHLGEQFTLVNNTGTAAVNGTFFGLAEGAFINLPDGTQFQISYQGGTNHNSVVLTTTAVAITQLTPTVNVSDAGGIYNGAPFPATATITDRNGVTGTSLEGVGLTVTYYSGTYTSVSQLAGLTGSTTAPSAPGSYTVLASFPGSTDYTAASAVTNFTITPIGVTVAGDVDILNQSASGALRISGKGVLDVAGTLQVDSNASSAVMLSGNASVNAGETLIVGGYQVTGNASFNVAPITHAADVADPLAALTAPAGGTSFNAVNLTTGTLTLNPGSYPSITVAGTAHLVLNPGIYSIGSGGINVSGNATIVNTGQGVLIYNTGALTVSGNASINLTAFSTGIYAGLAIFQAPGDASAVAVSGNANVNLNGNLLYDANARSTVTLSGNAQFEASLVVNELIISGNADDGAQ